MLKLNKKVVNSSLVVLLALGLGGCAANSATTTHKAHDVASSQVVKQSSHKKADNKSAKTASEQSATMVSNRSTVASHASTTTKSANAATTASSSNANNAVAPAKAASQSTGTVKQNEQKQLGLGDVATWTDSKGTTHHVDSDGMDRYTVKGSSQVQYQDFSGSLPVEAVISQQK